MELVIPGAVWIGLRRVFGRWGLPGAALAPPRYGHARHFRHGFVVNLLNPKTALFFFAFLPQFVEVSRGHVAMQIAFLGLLFAALGFATDGCYAVAAGTAGSWLKRSRGCLRLERHVSGTLFIGVAAAFAGSGKK
jgi:threonine/homoserine/homoserine lactone efflux protein